MEGGQKRTTAGPLSSEFRQATRHRERGGGTPGGSRPQRRAAHKPGVVPCQVGHQGARKAAQRGCARACTRRAASFGAPLQDPRVLHGAGLGSKNDHLGRARCRLMIKKILQQPARDQSGRPAREISMGSRGARLAAPSSGSRSARDRALRAPGDDHRKSVQRTGRTRGASV